jgi:predicted DNA-binding transcriptional regulator AlpA
MELNESTRNFDALPDSAYVPSSTTAVVLGVSQATVWRMAKAGKLTAQKVSERATRFRVGEIRALLAEGGQA